MRIGLVGANGEVGTELSFLLRREESTEVVPIVRSQIAASTFETHDFNYRVGEITDDEQAKTLLEGLDGVIVAAYAP